MSPIALALVLTSTSHPAKADSIAVSFAFFGCNRLEKADIADGNPSSANLPQLQRTFQDISLLKPVPSLVFAGGDIVMNYENDEGQTLTSQLTGWQKQFFSSPLAGKTTLIPFPGNHETNRKIDKLKVPNPLTTAVWDKWYAQSGFKQMAANGPTAASDPADRLADDQSRLNYSFTVKGVHFVVLNTDTATKEMDPETKHPKVAWIPAEWARKDIEKAQGDASVKSIFVLGHRNLVDPTVCKGDSPIDKEPGQKLLQALRVNPKVRAYVCAHVHAWDLDPLGGPSKAWQVVAGNGGSKLEDDWKPSTGTFFGFVVINVYDSGKVVLRNFKRPTPAGSYSDSEPAPQPAKPVDTVLFDPVK